MEGHGQANFLPLACKFHRTVGDLTDNAAFEARRLDPGDPQINLFGLDASLIRFVDRPQDARNFPVQRLGKFSQIGDQGYCQQRSLRFDDDGVVRAGWRLRAIPLAGCECEGGCHDKQSKAHTHAWNIP
ncbi:hypothetical protein GGR40_003063 [Novosphingobium gossypii]